MANLVYKTTVNARCAHRITVDDESPMRPLSIFLAAWADRPLTAQRISTSSAETVMSWENEDNTTAVVALAPFIAMTSAAMFLIKQDKYSGWSFSHLVPRLVRTQARRMDICLLLGLFFAKIWPWQRDHTAFVELYFTISAYILTVRFCCDTDLYHSADTRRPKCHYNVKTTSQRRFDVIMTLSLHYHYIIWLCVHREHDTDKRGVYVRIWTPIDATWKCVPCPQYYGVAIENVL